MPKFSATLLLTRPEDASARFGRTLAAALPARVNTVISPLLTIVPTGEAPDVHDFAGVIFTSARAVAYAGPAQPSPVYCVGQETRRTAEAAGWTVVLHAADAKALISALIKMNPPSPLVHLVGQHRRGSVATRLSAGGLPTGEAIVYDQQAGTLTKAALDALKGTKPVIAPLFSPRTAAIFCEQVKGAAPLYLVGISKAALLPTRSLTVIRAECAVTPDADAMKVQVLSVLRRVEARCTPL